MTFDHALVLNTSFACRPKLVKATGQEMFNKSLVARRMVNNGKGRTVVTALKVLFADVGSGLSLATETVSMIAPIEWGTTVSVTITAVPLVTLPSAPVIGLLLVERVP